MAPKPNPVVLPKRFETGATVLVAVPKPKAGAVELAGAPKGDGFFAPKRPVPIPVDVAVPSPKLVLLATRKTCFSHERKSALNIYLNKIPKNQTNLSYREL